MKVIALSTCHNRKKKTLNALDSLYNQKLPSDVSLEIVIVDDGSTDGTSEAISSKYGDVSLIKGSGNLFWNGGMQVGWKEHVSKKEFDYILVFNDDIELNSNALRKLIETANNLEQEGILKFAVVGAFKDSYRTSYSGVVRSSWWHPLRFTQMDPSENDYLFCDTLNMNFALISKDAIDFIGFLSPKFKHGKADYDFGLRLKKRGGKVVLAPGYVGECSRNLVQEYDNLSLSERWKRLTDIKSQSPRERAIYYRRHAGWFWPIFWALPYVRILVATIIPNLAKPHRR